MSANKFITPAILLVFILNTACSDSSTIDTIITPVNAEKIEGIIVEDNTVDIIEVINPHLSKPVLQPSRTHLIENAKQIVLLDTDLSSDRKNDDFVDDRGITPELIAYTLNSQPSKIFIVDTASRRDQVLFDLSTNLNIIGDTLICDILEAPMLDIEPLKQMRFERKQEQKLLFTTAYADCDNKSELNQSSHPIQSDENSSYTVLQTIALNDKNSNEITYETQAISYDEYKAERKSAPASLFQTKAIIANYIDNLHATLSFFPDNLTSTGVFRLESPIGRDEFDTFNVWQESVSLTNTANTLAVLNPSLAPNFSEYVILRGNQVLRIALAPMLEQIQSNERRLSLENPIYTFSNLDDANDKNIALLNSGLIIVSDNQSITKIEPDDTVTPLSSLGSNVKSYSMVRSTTDILLKETFDDTSQAFSIIEPALGGKSLIRGNAKELFTYDYQDIFDYVDISTNERYANRHDNGTPKTPYADSAWLSMKNYLEDTHERYILHTENSQDGLLGFPELFIFDALEQDGQGESKGTIYGVIASIEEAAIINERFGMLWVKESFEDSAPIQAYYFNPSDDIWDFTKVSEDTILPAWLPDIAY